MERPVQRSGDEQRATPEQEAEAQQAAVAAQVLRPGEGAAAGPAPHSHGAPGEQPVDARPERLASYDVNDFPVPGGREEEWRFTPLDRLGGLHDGTAASAGAGGRAEGTLLVDVDAAAGVDVETVGRDDPRVGRTGAPLDRVAAQAYSSFEKATVISVPAGTVTERPTAVSVRGEGGAAFGHVVVEVGSMAEAVVIFDCHGTTTYAENVEFLVGDGAKLTVVAVQDWDGDAVHTAHHIARLGRDARFRSVLVTFGGNLVRVFPRVVFDGQGGDAELLGVYFADAGQHLEQRLLVDHAVANCRSRVTYKGALQGDGAHAVWIGDVIIRAAAEGTDTYELNRNLVLTDGARADSVPNLEIETGEVIGAGHASATGRFDDEQLFYLMSRGVAEDEARRLVVRGFFADVINKIGIPEIEERLIGEVEAELEKSLHMPVASGVPAGTAKEAV